MTSRDLERVRKRHEAAVKEGGTDPGRPLKHGARTCSFRARVEAAFKADHKAAMRELEAVVAALDMQLVANDSDGAGE